MTFLLLHKNDGDGLMAFIRCVTYRPPSPVARVLSSPPTEAVYHSADDVEGGTILPQRDGAVCRHLPGPVQPPELLVALASSSCSSLRGNSPEMRVNSLLSCLNYVA